MDMPIAMRNQADFELFMLASLGIMALLGVGLLIALLIALIVWLVKRKG